MGGVSAGGGHGVDTDIHKRTKVTKRVKSDIKGGWKTYGQKITLIPYRDYRTKGIWMRRGGPSEKFFQGAGGKRYGPAKKKTHR